MFKIKINDIVKVYPSKSLCIVKSIQNDEEDPYRIRLKEYWKNTHNITLKKFKRIISVRFPNTFKRYDYPEHKKCLKRVFRQKSAIKKFKARTY